MIVFLSQAPPSLTTPVRIETCSLDFLMGKGVHRAADDDGAYSKAVGVLVCSIRGLPARVILSAA